MMEAHTTPMTITQHLHLLSRGVNILNTLSSTVMPWVITTDKEYDVVIGSLLHWKSLSNANLVYELDGNKMKTMNAFHDEMVHVFKFPSYYGRNANALIDCLTDDSILTGDSFAIIVKNSSSILEYEPNNEAVFSDVMNIIAQRWSIPICENKPWDRNAKPFHVFMVL